MVKKLLVLLGVIGTALFPALASAHEVYVLTGSEIQRGLATTPFDMVHVALQNLHEFVFWGFITFLVISTVFCISIFRRFETAFDPMFARAKRFAPAICRITVGLGLLAGAYYQATYGPELPLAATFGALTPLMTGLLVVIGIFIIVGMWVRLAAFAALCLFALAVWFHGIYMLTYTNYLGEFIVLLAIGVHGPGHRMPAHPAAVARFWRPIAHALSPYSFVILRIAFGISLLYAALYAKILHNNLALQVASLPLAGHAHSVASYLHFEPHFLVLGAALIELIIALFFIFGIEIRWTSLFLEFWLALSLIYFGEIVWPHLILIGIPIAFFFWGYDRYSLEGRFFKKHHLEPVL